MVEVLPVGAVRVSLPSSHLLLPRVRRFTSRLRGEGFAANTARLATGTAVAHALSIATMPLLAWVYRPEDFAVLGLFITFVTFASNLAALRYEAAIVAADSDADCRLLTLGAAGVSVVGSALGGVALWWLTSRRLFGYGILPPIVPWLAGFAIFQTTAYNVLRQWAVRHSQFGVVSRSTMVQGAGRFAAQGGLALVAPSSLSLIVAEILSRFVGVRQLLRHVGGALYEARGEIGIAAVVGRLRAYSHFPKLGLPSTFVNAVALLLPLSIVSAAYGPAAGGAFFLAQRILGLPALLLGRGVADALMKHVSDRRESSPNDIRRFLLRVVVKLLVIGAVPTFAVALLAPWVFPRVFGPEWETAGWMVAAIAPRSLAALAVSPLSHLFALSRSFHRKLVYDAAQLSTNALIVPALSCSGMQATPAVAIASLCQAAAYGLLLHLVMQSLKDGLRRAAEADEEAVGSVCRVAVPQ